MCCEQMKGLWWSLRLPGMMLASYWSGVLLVAAEHLASTVACTGRANSLKYAVPGVVKGV